MNLLNFALISATLLVNNAQAFAPSKPAALHPSTSLSMSAALIVQNKGGGHGELGKLDRDVNIAIGLISCY